MIPGETGGPFPADGSNGPNVLAETGIVRRDIRSSLGAGGTVAPGIPLTVALTIVDTANGCRPLNGAAVYIWHCDRNGLYSMYDRGAATETYLRGVQPTDAAGVATFTSIFPAAYTGRWPHVHFEIFPSLAAAGSTANKLATSQLAIPRDVCEVAFATPGYEASVTELARLSLESDNVFRDGWDLQLATLAGNPTSGYTATLVVGV